MQIRSTQRRNVPWWFLMIALLACLGQAAPGQEGLRRLHVGDLMPAFSLTDPGGTMFQYGQGQTRVLGLVILQAGQTHLDRLVADMETLARKLRSEGAAFDCLGVMSGPGADAYLRSRSAGAREGFAILADPNFAFWGKLGVIAAPTAVVVGADRKVRWIRAGYGYDFVAGFHAQLAQALGLRGNVQDTVQVETLENTSSRARRDRHIQLARALAQKGRLELATEELEKLRQLDPNAVDVALELGEVLCRAGKNEAALKLAAGIKTQSSREQARALLIRAWARRQMGQLEVAETLLAQALPLDPESARILYEMGLVYETRGDTAKALAAYRRALAQVFGMGDVLNHSQR